MKKTAILLPLLIAGYASAPVDGAAATNESVVGWGVNVHGELGAGYRSGYQASPVTVQGLSKVKRIYATYGSGYALLNDGTVRAWGGNSVAQLGDGSKSEKLAPVTVKKLASIVDLAVSGAHAMALRSDGTVMTWGGDYYGQLGNGTRACEGCTPTLVPIRVPGLAGVRQIAAGGGVDVALLNDGTVMVWGEDRNGQLGDGKAEAKTRPIRLAGFTHVAHVVAGGIGSFGAQIFALLTTGEVLAIGANRQGQLGDGTTEDAGAPVKPRLSGVTAISTNWGDSMALLRNGTVLAWGTNGKEQLGTASGPETCPGARPFPCSRVPRRVTGLPPASAIGTGFRYNAALASGKVYAWGLNAKGQLGDGTLIDRAAPVQVEGIDSAQQLAVGEIFNLALLSGELQPPSFAVTPGPHSLTLSWRSPPTSETWRVSDRLYAKPHIPWNKPVLLPGTARSYTFSGLRHELYEVRLQSKATGSRIALATPSS